MQFLKFLKSKGVLLSLAVLLVYGILVFWIYFAGYKPLPNKLTELPITIVEKDHDSKQFNSQLKHSLKSFKTIHETSDLKKAKDDLKKRNTYLIIEIPRGFTQKIKSNQKANLNFYVNEANQSLIVSGLKNVATNVGNKVNTQVVIKKGKAIFAKGMAQQLQKQNQKSLAKAQAQINALPAAQKKRALNQLQSQKQKQQQQLNAKIDQAYKGIDNSVVTNIHRVNAVKTGINYSMMPFFISLAAYLGALISTILLYGTYSKFAKTMGRFKSFFLLEMTMIILSIIGGLIVTCVLAVATGKGLNSVMATWTIHTLELFGSFNLNSVFILLLGQIGAALNILLTMLQVVAGAGMVPVSLMGTFFKSIHGFSPMYYSIMSDYDLLYSTGSMSILWQGALTLAIGYLVVNTIIIYFRKTQPMLDFASLA